jgi:hypothetical protein
MTLVHGFIQLFRSRERLNICPFPEPSRPALVTAKPRNKMAAKRTYCEYKHLPLSMPLLRMNTDVPNPAIFLSPLNAELNPIRHLLALVGAHQILHVSRIRVNDINRVIFNFAFLKTKVMQFPTSK